MPDAYDNLSDEELARRSRAGGAAAYEELVRRFQVPLVRFLTRRFPSRSDAEDILQDTFLKAWQSLHQFDDRYLFRTWLYTIAYRIAVSRGRHERLPEQSLQQNDAPSPAPRPEALAESEESRRSLWRRARLVLSEEQFTALWLFYVEDIPGTEVARVLNRSWVSVKTLMHRARKKLIPYLADEAPAGKIPNRPKYPPAQAIAAGHQER